MIVTMLTDFGTADYYVGAVKGTLLRLAGDPPPILVDVSHEVAPGSVETAAFLLGAAWRVFPEGTVHLAVVDPGVGSERRILAAERDGHRFVGPDNGVLEPILDEARAVAVDRQDLYLPAPGATFHGRDRFAPTAAALVRGEALEDLGEPVEDPVRLSRLEPLRDESRLKGSVIHVDRFGNVVTDIPASWLGGVEEARTWVGAHQAERIVSHYDQLEPGEAGLLVGSLGTLEVSLPSESLARTWSVSVGDPVEVRIGARERAE